MAHAKIVAHETRRRADRRAREGEGAIYTPAWLVARILNETLRHVRGPDKATFCDPTCGAGSFLAGARDLFGIAQTRLFGVDLDAEAVALARGRLPGAHLAVGEALCGLDWAATFPETGGTFDVLIGNPPFVRIQHLREHAPELADAVVARYDSARGNFDLYGPILELALERMRQAAGFVLPHRFFATEYGRHLRERLAPHVAAIVDFGDRKVFPGLSTYVCILVLARRGRPVFSYTRAWSESSPPDTGEIATAALTPEAWIPLLDDERRAWAKLTAAGTPLLGAPDSPASRLFVGLQAPSNRVFRLELVEDRGDLVLVRSAAEPRPFPVERLVTRPLLMGADVRRYCIRDRARLVLFPYSGRQLLDLPDVAPLATGYLQRHVPADRDRWWAYAYPKNLDAFEVPKILVGGVAARGRYAYDAAGRYYLVGGGDGGYSLVVRPGVDPWALLGILASRPLDFVLQRRSSLFNGRCYSYGRRFLHDLPIHLGALGSHVAQLTRARAELGEAGPGPATDLEDAIDRAVGEAYGLDASDWAAIDRLVGRRKI